MCRPILYLYHCLKCGTDTKYDAHGRTDLRNAYQCDDFVKGKIDKKTRLRKCDGTPRGKVKEIEGNGECSNRDCPKVWETKIQGDKYVGQRSAAMDPKWTKGDSLYTTYSVGLPDDDDASIIPSSTGYTASGQQGQPQYSVSSSGTNRPPLEFKSRHGSPAPQAPSAEFAGTVVRDYGDNPPQYPPHMRPGNNQQSLFATTPPRVATPPPPYGRQQQPYSGQPAQQRMRPPPTGAPVMAGSSRQPDIGIALSGEMFDPVRGTYRRRDTPPRPPQSNQPGRGRGAQP